jgi:maltooligosyltrehalose trehalohydrolase
MAEQDGGWWSADLPTGGPGDAAGAAAPELPVEFDYGFRLDGDPTVLPDPRSRRQPDGVDGLSRTFDPSSYRWGDDAWTGRRLAGSLIYELHIGTFTPEGTLDAAVDKLDYLTSIGVDMVELLPVNGFAGTHNWGYDGVLWFAVQESYGGPRAYQRFVDACHQRGIAVIQDVVYNHLGKAGNRSTWTAPIPARCAGTSWTTSSCGSTTITSTGCDWTRCTPWWTTTPCICWRRSRSRWTRWPPTSGGR